MKYNTHIPTPSLLPPKAYGHAPALPARQVGRAEIAGLMVRKLSFASLNIVNEPVKKLPPLYSYDVIHHTKEVTTQIQTKRINNDCYF